MLPMFQLTSLRITQYGFRSEEDFGKYDVFAIPREQLATAAKLTGDHKASTYNTISCTLREKLPMPKKQFKAYFVALLVDKEYAKVLETVAKVGKSFKTSTSVLSSSGQSSLPPVPVPEVPEFSATLVITSLPGVLRGLVAAVTRSLVLIPLCHPPTTNS